ncbi:hypothetical protein DLM78_20845 [Leptospira stimsonii]|uniref:Uncharacterized protein n=1 Tax=Leptospira stimsonii TaxID=2202203 RepID=A0A8B3CJI8_9LEPT|nr:hypothetical protein DLM78_20845 [Leptospira stimsonii]
MLNNPGTNKEDFVKRVRFQSKKRFRKSFPFLGKKLSKGRIPKVLPLCFSQRKFFFYKKIGF